MLREKLARDATGAQRALRGRRNSQHFLGEHRRTGDLHLKEEGVRRVQQGRERSEVMEKSFQAMGIGCIKQTL